MVFRIVGFANFIWNFFCFSLSLNFLDVVFYFSKINANSNCIGNFASSSNLLIKIYLQ